MRYHLATDEQLKTIITNDINCPTELLGGVVHEMLNRNLLDGLIKKAIIRRFNVIDIATKVLRIPDEDLFQNCRMEIVKVVKGFKQGYRPFSYYLAICLRTYLKDLENAAKAEMRKVYENIQSIDVVRNENGDTYAELFRSNMNVEREVIKKIMFEEKMNQLTPGEKQTFKLYLKGYSYREIGEMLSVSKAGICRRMEKATEKLCGKRISDLSIQNYKVGA
ncbi:sigma-70 family RNA polymerase sigma factor [Metabacillus sp. Hm71]|uniref:sigma-70 family RNA polymerase sigma factor n=1 Tax=Metabacillus sp. Hm71 TaxID=3450743 RepID=UPI003F432E27